MKVTPLKKFGQNYLTDKNIINKIIAEISPLPDDLILEIGPGTGALTFPLSNALTKLYAVELDRRVIDDLSKAIPNLTIFNEDFLEADLRKIQPDSRAFRIVGNIPYNITSPIIFKLLEERDLVSDAVLMMQYEVARRLAAKKDTKEYGILSVILGAAAQIKFCFKISPNVFYPRPKVDSALVHLCFNKDTSVIRDFGLFIKTVKAAFGNRRKTLKNSFGNSIFADADFSQFPVDLSLRAENLSQEDFVNLSNHLYEKGHSSSH